MSGFLVHLERFNQSVIGLFRRYAHWFHRMSLGVLFIWFGLLKPLGHKTTTSILAHVVY